MQTAIPVMKNGPLDVVDEVGNDFFDGDTTVSRKRRNQMLRSGILIVILAYIVFPNTVMAETVKQKEQRESFQKYLEAKLYQVNQKLDRLGSKAGDLKDDSKKEYIARMEELRRKQETAGKKMAEMKSASMADWDRLKTETSFAIDDLDKMYDKILSITGR